MASGLERRGAGRGVKERPGAGLGDGRRGGGKPCDDKRLRALGQGCEGWCDGLHQEAVMILGLGLFNGGAIGGQGDGAQPLAGADHNGLRAGQAERGQGRRGLGQADPGEQGYQNKKTQNGADHGAIWPQDRGCVQRFDCGKMAGFRAIWRGLSGGENRDVGTTSVLRR